MKIPRITPKAVPETPAIVNQLVPKVSDLWNIERDGLTQSMISTFLTCKEKFRLSYIEGWRPAKVSTAPMEFGNCIHEILDMIYSASKEYEPGYFAEEIYTAVKNSCKEYEEEKYERLSHDGNDWDTLSENVGIAEVLLPQYFNYWKEDWEHVEWLDLEEVFDVPLVIDGRTIRIRGKFDGVQRIKGKLWLFETKTKGRIEEDSIMDKLSIDLQVNLYFWAIWKKYGEFPAGVVYNIIRRPQLRQGKTEKLTEFIGRIKADIFDRPDFYFMRNHGSIDKSELLEWEQKEFIPIVREMLRWTDGDGHFKNVSACTSGFFACPFLRICGQNDTGTFMRRKALFEELTVVPVKDVLKKGVDTP
jgi:hypothetical protein